MKKIQLSDIQVGQSAVVRSVNNYGSIRRRFMDLGLIKGSGVCCILSSGKGMKAYNIRGAVIGIRQSDAARVDVEVENGEEDRPCRESQCRQNNLI